MFVKNEGIFEEGDIVEILVEIPYKDYGYFTVGHKFEVIERGRIYHWWEMFREPSNPHYTGTYTLCEYESNLPVHKRRYIDGVDAKNLKLGTQ